jgi:hypothetical protein
MIQDLVKQEYAELEAKPESTIIDPTDLGIPRDALTRIRVIPICVLSSQDIPFTGFQWSSPLSEC